MRSRSIIVAILVLLAPSTAIADDKTDKPPKDKAAKHACQAEKQGMGTKLFKETHAAGSTAKAMARCVAAHEGDAPAPEARVHAAKECKALRAEDADAFAEAYGTKRNAFGKCVSAKAREAGD